MKTKLKTFNPVRQIEPTSALVTQPSSPAAPSSASTLPDPLTKALTATANAAKSEASGKTKRHSPKTEAKLPEKVRLALGQVRNAMTDQKKGLWAQAFALATLKDACAAEQMDYLEVAQRFLEAEGIGGCSKGRVSQLVGTANYCRSRGLDRPPEDISAWPAQSLAEPLRKLLGKNLSAAKRRRADDLHAQVFCSDLGKRPSHEAVARIVDSILGPPKGRKGKDANDEPVLGLPPETVEAGNVNAWFKTNSKGGKLVIHRVRAAKRTPEALFAALKSDWKSLKDATLIRIEV